MHYLLFYEVGEDFVSRRAEFRNEHLEKAWKASARGDIVLAGALAEPADGAVLLFRGESPEAAERFAKTDPYVTNGLVKRWYVRPWMTVVGDSADSPVYAGAAPTGGILRMWSATASENQAPLYAEHAVQRVFPALRGIEGHRGAFLLRRAIGGAIELVVLTLWESMEAIRRFAGSQPEKAVVEPEARRVLTSFDETVTHFEVVASSRR